MRPVVAVHGIWDSARSMAPLVQSLIQRGHDQVSAIELTPPWGNAGIEELAEQLAGFVTELRAQHGASSVDVVGFSMGALVTRAYLQLLGGHQHVGTFVSISGPHRGTLTAYGLPLKGIRQMRPESPLLRALGHDVSHLASTRVHCLYTPFDALIVPSVSSILVGARSVHRVPVGMHRWMLADPRVHSLVAALLKKGQRAQPVAL